MEHVSDTLKGEKLQHWLKVAVISDNNGGHYVELRSTIHVNKTHRVTFSWGRDFSVADILNDNDLLKAAYSAYGRDIFVGQYTRDFN